MATVEERIHSWSHGEPRIRREARNYPEVKEVIPIVREEKNRGEWKRGLVLVLRRVVLRHEGHTIERPWNLVCSLEIKGPEVVVTVPMAQGLELRCSARCTGRPSEVAAVITRRRLRSDADHFCDAVVSTAKLLH